MFLWPFGKVTALLLHRWIEWSVLFIYLCGNSLCRDWGVKSLASETIYSWFLLQKVSLCSVYYIVLDESLS